MATKIRPKIAVPTPVSPPLVPGTMISTRPPTGGGPIGVGVGGGGVGVGGPGVGVGLGVGVTASVFVIVH